MEDFKKSDIQSIKEKAYFLRYKAIEDIEKNLLQLENKLTSNNISVKWAYNEESLYNNILEFLPNSSHNRVCLDIPHLSSLFTQDDDIISLYSLSDVENKEVSADTLIISSDFAVCENGSLIFINRDSKNCFNLVNNVIVIVNIDKIIVNNEDLSFILSLKNKDNDYYSFPSDLKIIQKPFKKIIADTFQDSDSLGYTEDPVKVSVIFYENNIEQLIENDTLVQSLYCIDCGRCKEVCEASKYFNSISPIELIKKSYLEIYNKNNPVFKYSTLCGNCQCVCPVNIPLTDLIIYEMQLSKDNYKDSNSKRLYSLFSKRSKLNKANKPFFRFFLLNWLFNKNRLLYNYFSSIKSQFFNIENTLDSTHDDSANDLF